MAYLEVDAPRPVYDEAGSLVIRLAETPAEVRAAQHLRFRVFCQEMSAQTSLEMAAAEREGDAFDEVCDHLLVFDRALGSSPRAVIGTYRLLRRDGAARIGRFYSEDEFDLARLRQRPDGILELGRSCVDPAYRSGATVQLLWRGIAQFVMHHDIAVMFGCASLAGTDPEELALPLSYLHHRHLAPAEMRPRALAERFTAMDRVAPEGLDVAAARRALPPLLKGYLRLGGMVGEGAVIDAEFGTTDVCVVVVTDQVTRRYYRHFTRGEPGAEA